MLNFIRNWLDKRAEKKAIKRVQKRMSKIFHDTQIVKQQISYDTQSFHVIVEAATGVTYWITFDGNGELNGFFVVS